MCKRLALLFLVILVIQNCYCQRRQLDDNPLIVGLHINAVNDSGAILSQPLNIRDNYNYSRPIKLSLEKRFASNYGIEFSGSFNRFESGKRINSIIISEDIDLLSVDAVFKMYYTNLFLNPRRALVEGFFILGIGNVMYDFKRGGQVIDIGGGFNFVITDNFRIATQGQIKKTISNSQAASNYIQLDLGCIFRI